MFFPGLPGRKIRDEMASCDYCNELKNCVVYQGETDSFGHEEVFVCADCVPKHKAGEESHRHGDCDYCKKDATDLRFHRDPDEGTHGPVYLICGVCAKSVSDYHRKLAAEMAEEMDEQDYRYERDLDDETY